ncbi:MAG: hypothetical protein AAGJ56_02415 [Myxococcota bacterium]
MLSLLKAALSFVVLLVIAYALFIVEVGGQSVASHARDVWDSAVVQNKLGAIKDDVRGQLQADLEEEARVSRGGAPGDLEISEADRKKLEALLQAQAD